jgi:hypothetical protein
MRYSVYMLPLVLLAQGCEVGETDTAEVLYPNETKDAGPDVTLPPPLPTGTSPIETPDGGK